MKHSVEVRRTVLLWAAVTMALWAALPLAMYWSHWQWFGWMPRVTNPVPPHPYVPHAGPPGYLINMATLLLMSAVVMAVVLWLLSLRRRED
jgi:hypothetical protein